MMEMNSIQKKEKVLDYLIKICLDNDLSRSVSSCKAILYSAYQITETIFTEEDWGIVYQRDVLINGRVIRFYPTIYDTKTIPTGWEWSWNTVTFVTKDDDSASKHGLNDELIKELKRRSGFYRILEEVND